MDENVKSTEDIDREFEQMLSEKKYKKLAFWALLVLFGGFVVWASFVPLDEGVPTAGKVVVDTKRKEIQHSTGGTLDEIYVKEGDFVKEDQLLVKLSDKKARSEVIIEKNNISSINESINVKTTNLKKIQDLSLGANTQLGLVTEELVGVRGLVKDGYVPRVRQLKLEKELAELETKLRDLNNNRKQTTQSIDELRFKLEAQRKDLHNWKEF